MAVLAHLVNGVSRQPVRGSIMPDERILGQNAGSGEQEKRNEYVYPELVQLNRMYWKIE